LISGPPLAREIERSLDVPLARVPRVESTSVMFNVVQTYSGTSANERLLVLVFDSAAATVQITASRSARGRDMAVIARKNAVVLYQHKNGTASRATTIRSALVRILPTG
jgi:hypothetical protein